MITAQHVYFQQDEPVHNHKISGTLMMDGVPYVGNIMVLNPGNTTYIIGLQAKDGLFSFSRLAEYYSSKSLTIMVLKEGRPFATELIQPDNVVTHDLVNSTTGGSAPTASPSHYHRLKVANCQYQPHEQEQPLPNQPDRSDQPPAK